MVHRVSETVILFALVSLTNTSPLRQPTAGIPQAQKRWFGSPCKPLPYFDLVVKLRAIGGYNKRYVATTKQEALKNFQNQLNTTTIVPNATSYATLRSASATPSINITQTSPTATTAVPSNISSPITSSTASPYPTVKPTSSLPSNFTRATPTNTTPTRQPGNQSKTQMISMGRRGTKDDYGFYRLCTEWTAITTLSSDFFPRYLNEVICDTQDFHCLSNGGLCVQKTFVVSILRRSGKCSAQGTEEWLEYSQPIRSCCECKMFPGSAYTYLL